MSETEKTETVAAPAEQVHPEVARVQAIIAQAAKALHDVQNLLYQMPQLVAGNIALAAELEKLRADVVKDVVSP